MKKLYIPEPVSLGIFLSYKCTSECKHCMYFSSPHWNEDWISLKNAEKILVQLTGKIQGNPFGRDRIGVNTGIHFTGGEPFLNFKLLLKLTKIAHELEIPSTFVETNCFWCIDDKTTREKLLELKNAGLHGILISVNPFILEQIPFEKTERAVQIGKEIFGINVIIYQELFYNQFKSLNIKDSLPIEEYLLKAPDSLLYVELFPMGRAPYALSDLYWKYPAKRYFGGSCKAELSRNWHNHIDNYFNYIPGYCGGISLGDARNLDSLIKGIDLEEHLILNALVTGIKKLYEIGVDFGYKELGGGYISKCHLCFDIRKHIVERSNEFEELRPKEFYSEQKINKLCVDEF
ncbi:4Fe-4S cluster-binding domain-containing protein [candidate division WOR-3 bacterium]|nr:4Fe-4S cluster-binding domain-containing protein [candidate division WOR-3 bacterium]